jgi:cation transport regulator ChaC
VSARKEGKISTNQLAIFAYGSLLFRPGFDYLERRAAWLAGYERTFSQASPDHRGTPERPGRVVTLRPRVGARTFGALYFVPAPANELLSRLDERERAGYERVTLEVASDAGVHVAVTWLALTGNAYDAGELPLDALAEHMRACHGPSGSNVDYVLELERALTELGGADPKVSELSAMLRR